MAVTAARAKELIQEQVEYALNGENSHCLMLMDTRWGDLRYNADVPFGETPEEIFKRHKKNVKTYGDYDIVHIGTIDLSEELEPQINEIAKVYVKKSKGTHG